MIKYIYSNREITVIGNFVGCIARLLVMARFEP